MKRLLICALVALAFASLASAQTVATSSGAPTVDGCMVSRDGFCVNLYTKFASGSFGAATTGADGILNTALASITGATLNPLASSNFVYNGVTWDRWRAVASAKGTAGTGVPAVGLLGYNGTTYDAVAVGSSCTNGCPIALGQNSAGADALGNTLLVFPISPGSNSPQLLAEAPHLFNGTSWDRQRTASLASDPVATTLTARNSIGAALAEKGSRWTVISNPAANSQATASIAAEAAVRHVADCISFSAGSTTAPALTALTINLRDGATGAGTIIGTWQVVIPASTGQNVAPFGVCGLNLVGTTNTAMTLEFSAGLTSLIESVTITGYNVN